MPPEIEDCKESVLDENPDYSESRAYAICWAEKNQGNLSVGEDANHDELLAAAAQRDGECLEGQVYAGDGCVPVEDVDAPPSILSTAQHLTLKDLDTEPIERIQEDDTTVRYTSLKLLSPGVWSDAGSKTATYYPPEGISNLDPHFDENEHDGPPLNIMHDMDVEEWEAHEPSIAGHIDPGSLGTDDDGNLYGDIVLDTSTGAGQYADENLKSTLENQGTVGFGGPSVEIPAEGLQQSHDPERGMPRVDGGRLTGAALVMDPASKNVNFAREAARRPIAMGDGSPKAKVLTRQDGGMGLSDAYRLLASHDINRLLQDMAEVQSLVESAESEGFDSSEQTVSDLIDFVREEMDPEDGGLEALQDAADAFLETVEAESLDATSAEAFRDWAAEAGGEMEEGEDEEDEEDDDTEMADGDLETVMERVQNLASRLEDVEDAVSQAMTADDVDQELEDAAGQKLADMETVEELESAKEELDRRLEELESRGKDARTLADAQEGDFEPVYNGTPSSESGW